MTTKNPNLPRVAKVTMRIVRLVLPVAQQMPRAVVAVAVETKAEAAAVIKEAVEVQRTPTKVVVPTRVPEVREVETREEVATRVAVVAEAPVMTEQAMTTCQNTSHQPEATKVTKAPRIRDRQREAATREQMVPVILGVSLCFALN